MRLPLFFWKILLHTGENRVIIFIMESMRTMMDGDGCFMKRLANRGLAMLLVLVLCLGMVPAVAQAATVSYKYSGSYVYNWGIRGEDATFLSPMAEDFYTGQYTYSQLSQLSGSASESSVPSSALYEKLQTLMSSKHDYITSYDATKNLYQYTDCQNNCKDTNKISSFYSGTLIGPSWDGGWNREHTWPNSKGDKAGSGENDIMMLRPTSSSENSSRGNKAYGQSAGYYNPNNESGGKYDLRGDAARIILYVYVRWGCTNTGSKYNPNGIFGTDGVFESKQVLLDWMEADPVDTWELGRNDSVESITGTRNVFVDYPELGFLLFGQKVPEDMTTPSGEAESTVSYSLTATAGTGGTVSVDGYTITAQPESGYAVSGCTVVSGSATVSRSGNVFTVRPSSDCAVRIDFALKTAVTLTYVENGITTATKSLYAGDSVTLPGNVNAPEEGYTFLGWSEGTVTDTTDKPTCYAPGSSYTVTAGTTLYALYVYTDGEAGTDAWMLVKDTSELTAGTQVVMASNTKGFVAGAMSGAILTNVDATFSGDYATLTDLPAGALVLTLGGSAGAWTLANDDGQLLGATAVKKLAWGSGKQTWSISVTNGTATIQNGTSSYGRFLYNVNSPRFTTYTSDANVSMLLPQLYRLDTSGVKHYTTYIGCSHEYVDGLCRKCQIVGDGEGYYATLADAIADSAGDYLYLNFDLTEDVVVDCDLTIDLNGKTLTGDIEILDGASLRLFDTATADYTYENRGRVVGSITGKLVRAMNTPGSYGHNYKYLTVQEEDCWSAHRIYLTVKSVSLAPCIKDGAGKGSAIRYKTLFKCSELVTRYVESYGVVLTGDETVTEDYGMTLAAGENWGTVRLDCTLSTNNTDEVNAANAVADVAVSARIVLTDGTELVSTAVTRSLQDLVRYADSAENLTDPQKSVLGRMYTLFSGVMESWDIPNIKSYAN